jgi:hypothetical protein
MHHLMLVCFIILLLLGLLNSQFYLFLAGKRGISFMLAAIPFHLLYHFYSGVSFIIGLVNHYGTTLGKRTAPLYTTLDVPDITVAESPHARKKLG